jgi:hypothetical protein
MLTGHLPDNELAEDRIESPEHNGDEVRAGMATVGNVNDLTVSL